MVGENQHVVKYFDDVMLHADDDKIIDDFLKVGFEQGKLHGRLGYDMMKQEVPDRFIALLVEFMNRGTVQDWIDEQILYTGGMLVVMHSVASALSHLHSLDISHNDIKPENVFLKQTDTSNCRSTVLVKLGDLGLAGVSCNFDKDYELYCAMVVCMASYKPFEQISHAPDHFKELHGFWKNAGGEEVKVAASNVPHALARLWAQDTSMDELLQETWLQGWDFFQGETEACTALDSATVETTTDTITGAAPSRLTRARTVGPTEDAMQRMSHKAVSSELEKLGLELSGEAPPPPSRSKSDIGSQGLQGRVGPRRW